MILSTSHVCIAVKLGIDTQFTKHHCMYMCRPNKFVTIQYYILIYFKFPVPKFSYTITKTNHNQYMTNWFTYYSITGLLPLERGIRACRRMLSSLRRRTSLPCTDQSPLSLCDPLCPAIDFLTETVTKIQIDKTNKMLQYAYLRYLTLRVDVWSIPER